jgi:hypothetical protein
MLQIYQPLITQDTGLPAEGALQATADGTQIPLSDEQPKPPLSASPMSLAEKEPPAEDKRSNNVLLVDDNEVNLRVRLPATYLTHVHNPLAPRLTAPSRSSAPASKN